MIYFFLVFINILQLDRKLFYLNTSKKVNVVLIFKKDSVINVIIMPISKFLCTKTSLRKKFDFIVLSFRKSIDRKHEKFLVFGPTWHLLFQ